MPAKLKTKTLLWLFFGEINTVWQQAQKYPRCRQLLHQVSGSRAVCQVCMLCYLPLEREAPETIATQVSELLRSFRTLFRSWVQLRDTGPHPHRFYAFQSRSQPGAVIHAIIAEMQEACWQSGQRSKTWSVHGQQREGKISLLRMQLVKAMTTTWTRNLKPWSKSTEKGLQSAVSNAF